MKKTISFLLVSTLLATAVFGLSACSQLDIAEQPDPVVIYAEKIYPSAIGNSLTDASVDVPAIDAYMEEYNKNADETAKINYDTIKYNKDAGYYYVNDKTTDVGMKFRLDQSMSIVNASIYTGTLDQTTKNVYNIVINAIETSGYKSLMTAEDKAIIQHTLSGFNGVSSAKNDVQQIFSGQENFAAKWQNNVAEFEIPVKPSELPKPDTSHTLADVELPTVEIPSITIDTTIKEGTKLDNGTVVKPQDITSIVNKIEGASSQIASVNKHNETSQEGVNKALDDIVVKATMRETGKLLTSASDSILNMNLSLETKELPSTKTLTKEVQKAYDEFARLTRVTETSSDKNFPTIYATTEDFFKDMDVSNKNKSPLKLLGDIIAAQAKVASSIVTLPNVVEPNNTPVISDLVYRPYSDGSVITLPNASTYATTQPKIMAC